MCVYNSQKMRKYTKHSQWAVKWHSGKRRACLTKLHEAGWEKADTQKCEKHHLSSQNNFWKHIHCRTIWTYSIIIHSLFISHHCFSLFTLRDHASPTHLPPTLNHSISLLKPYVLGSHSQTSLINTTVSSMVTKPLLPPREGEQARLDRGWRAWEGFAEDWHRWWGLMFLFSFCFECPCTPLAIHTT